MTKIPDPVTSDGNENVCSVQQIGRLFRSREMFDRDEQRHRRKKCENEVIRRKDPGSATQVETAKIAGDSRKAAFDLDTGAGQNSRDQKTAQHEEQPNTDIPERIGPFEIDFVTDEYEQK